MLRSPKKVREMLNLVRLANAVMLVLFIFWVGFQYNDPDALLWMAVYGAALIECVLAFMGRLPRALALAYAGICIVWAVYLGIRVAVSKEFFFEEQGREMMGLLICAGWTFMLIKNQGKIALPQFSTAR